MAWKTVLEWVVLVFWWRSSETSKPNKTKCLVSAPLALSFGDFFSLFSTSSAMPWSCTGVRMAL
eukprot:3536877-Alexandrium_andersonii.AAC.1